MKGPLRQCVAPYLVDPKPFARTCRFLVAQFPSSEEEGDTDNMPTLRVATAQTVSPLPLSKDETSIHSGGANEKEMVTFNNNAPQQQQETVPPPRPEAARSSSVENETHGQALDGDGNPIVPPVDRTWPEWWHFMRPCFIVTLFALLKMLSQVLTAPLLPFLLTEFYGGDVQQAAETQTRFDAGRAFVAMFMVPIYGKLLDTMGRRPFFILAAFLNIIPALLLLLWPDRPLYYLASNQVALVFSGTYQVAYIADNYAERDRAKMFAISTGIAALGTLIVLLTLVLSHQVIFMLSLLFVVLRLPVALFMVKETLPESERRKFQCSFLNPNPMPSVRLIFSNRVMKAVSIVCCMLVTTAVGTGEISGYYLIKKVAWTEQDNYMSAAEIGLLVPVTLLIVFPLCSKYMRPTRIVFLAFCLMIAGLIVLMAITGKWMFYAIVLPLLMGMEIGVPTLIGVFANAGDQDTQGMRMAQRDDGSRQGHYAAGHWLHLQDPPFRPQLGLLPRVPRVLATCPPSRA